METTTENRKLRLLIGYNGSSQAEIVLEDLASAGFPPEVEAQVITVDELWGLARLEDEQEIAESHSGALAEARMLAEQACAHLQARFPAWTIGPEVYAGSPARLLIQRADEWQADLVVVGAQSQSLASRLGLGSVAQQVATEAHCSVRVARLPAKRDSVLRLLIAVDGSPQNATAVRTVTARHWPPGAEVKLLTALLRAPVLTANHPWREWYQVRELHLSIAKELEAAGLLVSSAIVEGDPKQVLLEEAARWGADTIFVGATSLHRVARFLLGSVPTALLARAHCSVEIMRPDQSATAVEGSDALA